MSFSFAANAESASLSLQKADHYADLYNWADSKPFYLAAEQGLRRGAPDQIHAHLGYLRATMEERSLPELSNYLATVLKTPTVSSGARLRLWCLGIKGDVDGEMDSASARADWEEANRVAKQLGDAKWESRSAAEAGFEAYLQGDIATGRSSVAAALVTAHKTGDIGAEIRYLSAIGTGIEWNGAYKEAVVYFDKASALAKQHPDSGYPFLTVAGEVETLIKEGEFDSAERLIKQGSMAAVKHRKLIKLTQLMLFDADIAIGQQQLDRAIEILRKTILIAEHNRTNMLADAQMKLAKIYRQQHKLALAEQYATQAFSHTELTKNLFTAPARLEFAAQLQWDLGRQSQARRSITRALDISEGLLAQTSSGAVREGLLTEMSSAYETAFKFAAQSGDVSGAFSVVERVRGRITAETLVQPQHFSAGQMNIALEDEIRNLKIHLIKAKSESDHNRLIDTLFYAEQQRFVADRPAQVYTSRIEAIPLQRVIAGLDKDEALLEYVLPQDGNAYCLALTHRGANIIQLRAAKEMSGLALNFLNDIQADKEWRQDARALYDAVLAPIPDIKQFARLTIVPDGNLHLVPFEALLSPSGTLVGQTASTSYAPSAVSNFLNFLLKTRPGLQRARSFLGVGGAVYDAAASKSFTLAKATNRGAYLGVDLTKLPNLPGSLDDRGQVFFRLGTSMIGLSQGETEISLPLL